MQSTAKLFSDILKFNPYHDAKGRFASANSAASFTYKPGASTAHSKAIEREKAKDTEEAETKGFKGTLYHGSPNKDIKEFDMSRAGQNTSSGEKLLFFTDSKQMADDFSYERLDGSSKYMQRRGEKGRVYEVDVEMKNPLDFRNLSDKDIDNILKLDGEGLLTRSDVQRYADGNHQLLKAGLTLTSDSLKSLGYDGLIASTGKAGHNSLEYAVVDSKQAKIRKGYDMYNIDENFGLPPNKFDIKKADEDKRLVFGWALVSATSDGEKIIDHQGDIVEQDELESGAYEYVLNFRDAGEEHNAGLRKKARMVESVVFTAEKLQAMGIPEGTVPYGWWIGFYVDDDNTWELIKNGTYKMFSIEGRAIREPVTKDVAKSDSETVAKTFGELVEKFNPYHDRLGRFTTANGAASFTYAPGRSKAHDNAIAREKERTANLANPGKKYGLSQEEAENLANSSLMQFIKRTKELGWDKETTDKFKEEFKVTERRKERHAEAERKKREEEKRQRDEMNERVKQELPGLSQEAISRANSVSSFEHGSVAARDALRRVDAYKERNKITDDMTDEQKAYMKQREEEYKQLITDYYNDSNSRFANNPHSMITGPARFNTRAYDKKLQAAHNKEQEYEEKLKRFEENTQRKLKSMETEDKQIAYWRNGKYKYGEKIDPADPLAERKYQAKIDYLTEQNEKSKAANKYWNKNHTMTGFEGFSEATNTKLNDQFKRIYSYQNERDGNLNSVKSPFSTTNNAAEIRRNKQQLEQIQNRKASASSGGGNTSFKGGELIRNAEANRLQMKFDGIPDAATRQKLKSSGWRWSPKNGVWQRQLTQNAEYSANRIIEDLNKSYDGAKTFSELINY